jgi:NADH-quinone oxidoreductase subunit N
MQYGGLAAFLEANPHNFMAAAGIVLVLSGVAFKIGAFPFQIWIPDVYQGAPTPVTAFLAVASKAAGFIVLLVLVTQVFPLCLAGRPSSRSWRRPRSSSAIWRP